MNNNYFEGLAKDCSSFINAMMDNGFSRAEAMEILSTYIRALNPGWTDPVRRSRRVNYAEESNRK